LLSAGDAPPKGQSQGGRQNREPATLKGMHSRFREDMSYSNAESAPIGDIFRLENTTRLPVTRTCYDHRKSPRIREFLERMRKEEYWGSHNDKIELCE
jgi:hypothetical protein